MPDKVLAAGGAMPLITLPTVAGDTINLGGPADQQRLIMVYRGVHDQTGVGYLDDWHRYLPELANQNTALYLISGDTRDEAAYFADRVRLGCPIGYDLTLAAMRQLGLYVSEPISRWGEKTSRPIPEPALFLVDTAGNAHIVSISNSPFVRPDPGVLLSGMRTINHRNYPVRGTLT